MKAPDKIYLEKSLSNPDRLHSQWYPNDVIGGGIEYIRKEALLKWINTSKNSLLMDTKAPHLGKVGSLATLDALTDMLNEM